MKSDEADGESEWQTAWQGTSFRISEDGTALPKIEPSGLDDGREDESADRPPASANVKVLNIEDLQSVQLSRTRAIRDEVNLRE